MQLEQCGAEGVRTNFELSVSHESTYKLFMVVAIPNGHSRHGCGAIRRFWHILNKQTNKLVRGSRTPARRYTMTLFDLHKGMQSFLDRHINSAKRHRTL